MTPVSEEKKQLIEDLGLNMEEQLRISPLAARIYALLVLSPEDGLMFDQIQDIIQASKSSISTNLKVLTQLKYVTYYTKSRVRKKYFKIAKYFQLLSLEEEMQSLKNQLKMVEKINAFNKKYYPEKFTNEQSLGEIVQRHLRAYQILIEKAITEIAAYKNKDFPG